MKVQRPGIEPIIMRDLFIFRALGSVFNAFSQQRLGCNAELVVDEFGEKLLEELDYMQVAALSIEVRQKLQKHRPETLGQASRISGVTPAAVSLLLVHLKKGGFQGFTTPEAADA